MLSLILSSLVAAASTPSTVNPDNLYQETRFNRITNQTPKPSTIVLNWTGRKTLEESYQAWTNRRVSTQDTIDTDGTIYDSTQHPWQQTNELNERSNYRTWHVAYGNWTPANKETFTNPNSHIYSIKLVHQGADPKDNPNRYTNDPENSTTWFNFSPAQIAATALWIKKIQEKHNISNKDIIGYGEIASTKANPEERILDKGVAMGPEFPWKQLAHEYGVGFYHTLSEEHITQLCPENSNHIPADETRNYLTAWGYSIPIIKNENGTINQEKSNVALKLAVTQAQMHHDAQNVDGNCNSCRLHKIFQNLHEQFEQEQKTKHS
ncbi:MAG: N-acetylmuramoyl-L-alanine amidase [Candidatus Chromulinivorax sp.]